MSRTLVVGWDAVSWDYVDELLQAGALPNLETLLRSGCRGTFASTVPPITPVAWSTVITGKSPQKHGVFDWVSFYAGQDKVTSSLSRLGTPFWDRLETEGYRVGLVNVPMTYPPKKVNGFMLCGFGAPPDAEDLSYPPELKHELQSAFGAVNAGLTPEQRESLAEEGRLFNEELQQQNQQVEMALYLADRYEVDLLMINLMLFDHTNHGSRSLSEVFHSLAVMDRHLGNLVEGYRPTDVVVFGDHGSRRVVGEFLLGDWLKDNGYLVRKGRTNQNRNDLNFFLLNYLKNAGIRMNFIERPLRFLIRETLYYWPHALSAKFWRSGAKLARKAFEHYWFADNIDLEQSPLARLRRTGLLYVNRSEAALDRDDSFVSHLVEDLNHILDPETGSPLFAHIWRSEDLYGSECQAFPPDLVLDYHRSRFALYTHMGAAYEVQGGYFAFADDNQDAAVWSWRGDHKPEGICVLSGKSFVEDADIGVKSIVDITPTLLHLFAVPVPDDYDGTVISEAFREKRVIRRQPGDVHDNAQGSRSSDRSRNEDAQIMERLKALGYLE